MGALRFAFMLFLSMLAHTVRWLLSLWSFCKDSADVEVRLKNLFCGAIPIVISMSYNLDLNHISFVKPRFKPCFRDWFSQWDSRPSVAQTHWWLIYHGCFELVLESLDQKPIVVDLGQFRVNFFFIYIIEMVYCVYSLESPRWGDSNECTQYAFIWKKIENISELALW